MGLRAQTVDSSIKHPLNCEHLQCVLIVGKSLPNILKKGANNTISFHVKIFIFADIIRRYQIVLQIDTDV